MQTSEIGQKELATQKRIINLFKNELNYDYLGNWEHGCEYNGINENQLLKWFNSQGYNKRDLNKTLDEFNRIIRSKDLYNSNKEIYSRLRYGFKYKPDPSSNTITLKLVDWDDFENNHFAIAEEVSVKGTINNKRPDIVIYVNGFALGVIELKRSNVTIGEGIRQNITNQQIENISKFFSTVQFIFAANDTEGLRYGTIGTEEKYYLTWKEEGWDYSKERKLRLDQDLKHICNKSRFLELIHEYVVFDAGTKKLPRPHQYFGIQVAQEHIKRREGGIIWHTQGSGKSIVMVLLAQWIRENISNSRILIVTDRDELDKQIEEVFQDSGESKIERCSSGKDLISKLENSGARIFCSLIHKFKKHGIDDHDRFIKEIKSSPSVVSGDLYVFVDECHRTQSNKLHEIMKATLRNSIFIGFTGTPLLKQDKKTSLEVFGRYIHTYKFNEAVKDGVILDLAYEARDIDQKLSSPEKVDEWFEAKTKNLNDYQKSELKTKWGTMQKVLSSRSRMNIIVKDICYDFSTIPRLNEKKGNSILVAKSIYQASRYYELFQSTEFKGKVGLVTSYNPSAKDVRTEDTGANTETEKQALYNTYENLLKDIQAKPNKTKAEVYEDLIKTKFRKEPANMKLLVVVDKLLTGFDAPSCSYLYIDKKMQDHGLFQAICRVNRLDDESKAIGSIVDYMDIFKKVKSAVAVYTAELDYDSFKPEDCDIVIQSRLEKLKEKLESSLEQLELLCEPVPRPKEQIDYYRYFAGELEDPQGLKATEERRSLLYKFTIAYLRAYANASADFEGIGYSISQQNHFRARMNFYLCLRDEIKTHSGETIDLKTYEADMRYLIDNYIQAEDSQKISDFKDASLLEIIESLGIEEAIGKMPDGIKKDKESVAETIENNIRQKIIQETVNDPAFFGKISKLLDEVIKERKAQALSYEEYLKELEELIKNANRGSDKDTPRDVNTKGKHALYNNLNQDLELTLKIDSIIHSVKQDSWRGNQAKENQIKKALFEILADEEEVERIFILIENHEEY